MKNSFLALAAAALVATASFASADAVVATELLSGSMGTNGSTLTVGVQVASNDTGLLPSGGALKLIYDTARVTYVGGSAAAATGPGTLNFTAIPAGPNSVSGSVEALTVGLLGAESTSTGRMFTAQFTVVDSSVSYAITVEGKDGGTATLSNDLINGSGTQIARTYNNAATTYTASSVADWAILD